MQDQKILIIGGAGFIGVNAARYFASRGWEVTVLDNLARKGTDFNLEKLREDLPSINFVKGDIRTDNELLLDLAEKNDVVLHLAAQVAVTTSVIDPKEDFDINALGTFNVLEAVRQSKRQPIVLYASTNKVYGGLEQFPVDESETRYSFRNGMSGVTEEVHLDFHSPYGCSKGAADQYVRDYARIYELKTVVFRQSCIYGPHQLGIEDQGWVAWFMIAGLFGREITLYGTGKQVRDLLFVEDLVRAYELAIENIAKASGEVYNLGGGSENTLSLIEFLNLLEGKHQLKLNKSQGDERPGDQPMFVSNNTKIESELGWRQEWNVEKGIAALLAWLKENKEGLSRFYS
jgi:CDP-paratose 2-epimerase